MATDAHLQTEFPPLPYNLDGWSANVINAHKLVGKSVKHALTILRQEDSDPLRFCIVSDNLVNNMLPILESMRSEECPKNSSKSVLR